MTDEIPTVAYRDEFRNIVVVKPEPVRATQRFLGVDAGIGKSLTVETLMRGREILSVNVIKPIKRGPVSYYEFPQVYGRATRSALDYERNEAELFHQEPLWPGFDRMHMVIPDAIARRCEKAMYAAAGDPLRRALIRGLS